ncbi:DUF3088 domain-containing protein [Stakelama sediminis]|uniref:DUF3088 family protein n=1 Tax=Stakelama sediminis TaxID=463200 RepID=A0A840YWW7_9SPHN|nr:DUF3088 family protein [Stakelama sediminis]MBB5718221.1 hypothetical protein [Stakelama sediminis]
MTRDRLYLLDREFDDAVLPGRSFYCKDCVTVEGLLALFPEQAKALDVIRVPYPRPRAQVVEAIGEENQNLPALVFAGGGFVNEIEALLAALHTRHGFPERHP